MSNSTERCFQISLLSFQKCLIVLLSTHRASYSLSAAKAGMAELVDATDLKSVGSISVPVRFRLSANLYSYLLYLRIIPMWFTIHKTWDLNTNERIIAYYKKELWASHIIDTAKNQQHYNTKWYRRFVAYNFPASRRYRRMRAIVSSAYKRLKKKYGTLAQLGMKI